MSSNCSRRREPRGRADDHVHGRSSASTRGGDARDAHRRASRCWRPTMVGIVRSRASHGRGRSSRARTRSASSRRAARATFTPVRHTWTIEMAKRAGLAGRGVGRVPARDAACPVLRGTRAHGVPDFLFGVYAEGEIPEEPRRAERATVTHDAPGCTPSRRGRARWTSSPAPRARRAEALLDAWAAHSARLTQAGAIDDAKARRSGGCRGSRCS